LKVEKNLQSQSQRNTTPQPLQLPPQSKRRPERNRHRNHIVAKQIHISPDLLSSEAAKQTITVGGEGIEELEGGAEREDGGDEVDDALVIGEELGNVVAEG
jgi:hypothetical protein